MFVKQLKLENLERPSMFCKALIAIVNNAVAPEDFDEAKVRPLSDYGTHLKSSVAITEERRLLCRRKKGSLEIALCCQSMCICSHVGIFM